MEAPLCHSFLLILFPAPVCISSQAFREKNSSSMVSSWATLPSGNIHLLFHELQYGYLSQHGPFHRLQGINLLHRGLLYQFQGSLCSSTWSTSSTFFFPDFSIHCVASLTFFHNSLSHPLLYCILPFLQYAFPDVPPSYLQGSDEPCTHTLQLKLVGTGTIRAGAVSLSPHNTLEATFCQHLNTCTQCVLFLSYWFESNFLYLTHSVHVFRLGNHQKCLQPEPFCVILFKFHLYGRNFGFKRTRTDNFLSSCEVSNNIEISLGLKIPQKLKDDNINTYKHFIYIYKHYNTHIYININIR